MQVYFIRHGQTNYNLLNLCNDVVDKQVSLTEIGKQQAASLANTLKDVHIDKILVSELPRTRQTADIINLNRQQLIIAHEETLRVFKGAFESLNDHHMIDLHFDNCAVLHYTI